MAKKNSEQDSVDKDLADLYKSASKHKIECPNCKHVHEVGGDFSEMARAMELRIKFEALKKRTGLGIRASNFEEEE